MTFLTGLHMQMEFRKIGRSSFCRQRRRQKDIRREFRRRIRQIISRKDEKKGDKSVRLTPN